MDKKVSNEIIKEVAWYISIAQDLIEKENFTDARDKISIGIKSLSQSHPSSKNEDSAELMNLLESIDSLTNKTINAFNQYKLSFKQYDDAVKSYRNLEEKVKRLEESSSKMQGISAAEEAAELIELEGSRQLLRSESFPRDDDYDYREKEGEFQEFKSQLNEALGKFLSRITIEIKQDKEIVELLEQAATDGATKLDLSCYFLHKLPPKFFKLTNLVELNLSYNHIHNLPPKISQLTNLAVLNLSYNYLQSLPNKISLLTGLTELYIRDNNIKELPPKFIELISLRVLDVSNNKLTKLPNKIGQLKNLRDAQFNGNHLKIPPQEIAQQGLAAIEEYFSNTSDKKVVSTKKVFISYSWDNDEHKKWVRDLATRLRSEGIDVTLDQWDLVPGDQLPEFMERAIRESDYVLIVCTHKYKDRSDKRQGGVGYEGDIITAEFMTTRNQRKFIPLLRQQSWQDSAPSSMAGKYYIDFSSSPYSEKSYDDLQTTILGTREKAPPIGIVIKSTTNPNVVHKNFQAKSIADFDPIQITGIIADQVGVPRNDGTEGSALYKIPFRLSQRPPHEWAEIFIHNWNHPSRFSSMHRPGNASVIGDTVILDGTTIEEVKEYHRDTLMLITQETNKAYNELIERARKAREQKQEQLKLHKQNVDDISNQIKFDD